MNKHQWMGLVACLVLYVIGIFFPQQAWGIHFLSFTGTLPVFVTGIYILLVWLMPVKTLSWREPGVKSWVVPATVSLVMMALIMAFPIVEDFYGDAYKFKSYVGVRITEIPDMAKDAMFRLNASPWDGEKTILSGTTYLAYATGWTYGRVFLMLDVLCAVICVLIFGMFVLHFLKGHPLKWPVFIAVMTLPMWWIFFGHMEIYAPVMLVHTAFLLLLVVAFTKCSRRYWGVSVVFYVLAVKMHGTALLYAPALLVTGLYVFGKIRAQQLSWKMLGRWVVVPQILGGLILYFFVFGDHRDERRIQHVSEAFERLFLPLFSPPPPLDHYNLFSGYHILDFMNAAFLWSPFAWVLMASLWKCRVRVRNLKGIVPLMAVTFLVTAGFYFMINPLLSMPMDADLFSLPSSVLVVLMICVIKECPVPGSVVFWKRVSLSLVPLMFGVIWVNSNRQMLSARLEVLARYNFVSYYEWTAKILGHAFALEPDYERKKERWVNAIDSFRPQVDSGYSNEYARLLTLYARYLIRDKKMYDEGIAYLQEAWTHDHEDLDNLMYTMEAWFLKNRFDKAYEYALLLKEYGHPNKPKSYKIALHCAIGAGMYAEAQALSKEYIEQWDDSEQVREVYRRLKENDSPETLMALFAGS
ncbi:MAG: hypothetical protein KDD36_03570 [Flavobacteriales bacterium]|nr:hypothetical protein [Flavobacteriales bacterium]